MGTICCQTQADEANSIPLTAAQSSQTPTVAELSEILYDLVEWESVAVHLRGMTSTEIQKINRELSGQAIDNRKQSCFSKWLSTHVCPDASWDDVVTALKKGKELALAEKVRKEKVLTGNKTIVAVSEDATKQQLSIFSENEEMEIIKELNELHDSFAALLLNILKEIEEMVGKNETSLTEISRTIQLANSRRLGNLTNCKTVFELNDKIISKCSFLDGSILHSIVKLGLPQNKNLILKAKEHMERAREFRKKAPIKQLKNQINGKITGASQAPLVIKLNNVWDRANIDHVTMLIEYLADNKEIGPKTISVLSSSVKVTLLISENDKPYFNITTEHKEQFMCLIGMFYLQVGEHPPTFQEDENMNYTFENGLLEAAKTGHLQAIEFILSIGINLDYQNNEGKTALLLASEHGHSETVKSLLSAGASVDIQDNIGLTAVMVAKTVDIYQTLAQQANANTNIVTHKGSTSLMVSCLLNNHEVANYLLFTLKHNITTRPDGLTLLMAASQGGNEKIAENLLDNGHDSNIQDNDGRTALGLTCFYGQSKVTDILLKHNTDPNIPDNDGWTPLMTASLKGHHKIVELLLQNDVDPNTTNSKNGETALIQASQKGHIETVELLLSNMAEPNIQSNDGVTAIHVSCSNGHYAVTDILLNHNADPNVPEKNGWTPLMAAASQEEHHKIVELSQQKDIDSNYITNNKNRLASQKTHNEFETVELLLSNGADPNIQDVHGVTALQISCFNGHYTVTEILLKHNADPNTPDNDGWTPLMNASQEGHHEIVELLLQKDVDPNITNRKNGKTAVMLASQKGHHETVELLLSNG